MEHLPPGAIYEGQKPELVRRMEWVREYLNTHKRHFYETRGDTRLERRGDRKPGTIQENRGKEARAVTMTAFRARSRMTGYLKRLAGTAQIKEKKKRTRRTNDAGVQKETI